MSENQPQHFGKSQGCLLSRFVFARDDKGNLGENGDTTKGLVYADDALIAAAQPQDADEYMCLISSAGAQYGLESCQCSARRGSGSQMRHK